VSFLVVDTHLKYAMLHCMKRSNGPHLFIFLIFWCIIGWSQLGHAKAYSSFNFYVYTTAFIAGGVCLLAQEQSVSGATIRLVTNSLYLYRYECMRAVKQGVLFGLKQLCYLPVLIKWLGPLGTLAAALPPGLATLWTLWYLRTKVDRNYAQSVRNGKNIHEVAHTLNGVEREVHEMHEEITIHNADQKEQTEKVLKHLANMQSQFINADKKNEQQIEKLQQQLEEIQKSMATQGSLQEAKDMLAQLEIHQQELAKYVASWQEGNSTQYLQLQQSISDVIAHQTSCYNELRLLLTSS
jgi:hypothetical protein